MAGSDTIAAIATGLTNAGISVIRVSGDEAFYIGNKIFRAERDVDFTKEKGYTAHYGKIVSGGEELDEVVVLIMRGPRSYTGEDTLEISCHGGALVTRRVLEAVIAAGARSAEPGEFTKRAFLNGRMDLSEAEAVINLIDAKNDFAMKASVGQLRGKLSDKIKIIRENILNLVSYIEAALDDPEHISLEGYDLTARGVINGALSEISSLIDSFEDGKVLSEGVKTVILGKPNAGKSSLMNLFAGEEKAIVTEIAGTTRDVLSEQITISGIGFNMVDTAGIRDTEDTVEKIGVERSLKQASEADLILYVVDSSTSLDENDERILRFIKDKKSIVVYNKTDLEAVTSVEDVREIVGDARLVGISAKEATDFEKLKECMADCFRQGEISLNDQVVITSVRHKEALLKARESLKAVVSSMDEGFGEDIWVIDMMDAYTYLGEIIGEAVEEDVVDRIFEKFCMGK